MSSQQSFETPSENATPTAILDADFRLIANEVPINIRRDAFAGQQFHLCSLMTSLDLGRDISEPGAPSRQMYGLELNARYLGHRLLNDDRVKGIPRRLVELQVRAIGENVASVRFCKTYEVGFGWILTDTAPTPDDAFEGCPVPPGIILLAASTLRQAYQATDVTKLPTRH
ncbi:hypothetical protein H7097_02375 [Aeromicrobium sp.]|nr:hypothetical protein [Candidatus Saccharibacteria bacterium]